MKLPNRIITQSSMNFKEQDNSRKKQKLLNKLLENNALVEMKSDSVTKD